MEQNHNKKDNRGYLYPNGNKSKPTHPDYTGTIITNGKEWRLAAWENKTSEGKQYLSLVVTPPLTPEQQQQYKTAHSEAQNSPSSQEKQPSNTSTVITNDLDDLDAILKSADEDSPFF